MGWLTILEWLNPLELVKAWLKRKKDSKKLVIYKALEQTRPFPPSLAVEQISKDANFCAEEVESLLYEMVQEGTIREGPFPGTYTRYPR